MLATAYKNKPPSSSSDQEGVLEAFALEMCATAKLMSMSSSLDISCSLP